uniref:Lipoprotein n=1 Tax=Gracilinema caldarium TaxID=215591 RepID=A0A7C3E1B2_9SPIR
MKHDFGAVIIYIVVLLSALSCQTQQTASPAPFPAQTETTPPSESSQEIKAVQPEPTLEATFDPSSITQEVFDATKGEVQALIEKLNQIIRNKDYEAWVQYLSPSYKSALSDADFLKNVSESSRLKNQKIVLKSLEDYFLYVVVPSRANDRVDDIEFIGQNRVKAYTITSKGQRLRLYELEKTAGNWNIVN